LTGAVRKLFAPARIDLRGSADEISGSTRTSRTRLLPSEWDLTNYGSFSDGAVSVTWTT
jgi:hypothetical protein